ncbi:hypothetical protein [uncultured Gammaproteobacteria bacterium]|nr:hypothetical protein [uncultured Gammaproteobacteria bacterium]
MVFCFKLLSQFVFLQLKYYSPPHRWLRNSNLQPHADGKYSPPHRWLRNIFCDEVLPGDNSPPHRWLRKNNAL